MGFFKNDIGIDLGTSYIRIYVKGKGIEIEEPSVALISQSGKRRKIRLLALGHNAQQSIGRESAGEKTVFPISHGVIVDNEVAIQMLHALVTYATGGSRIAKPRIFITYPSNTIDNNKLMLRSLCVEIGAGKTILISKPFAAAAGGGYPIYDAKGSLVVDIGAGTMDIAVISLGGIALSHSITYAGQKMNDSLMAYFRAKNKLDISNNTAESLKLDLACAVPQLQERYCVISGKYIGYGNPESINVSSSDVYEALSDSREAIIRALSHVLKNIPTAMIPDIMERGIFLTGGVSNMPGLRELISKELKIQVNILGEPNRSAIYGLKNIIDGLDKILKDGTSSFLEVE